MDKDETLWIGSKLGLDLNGGLKSIYLTNMTHLSLEKALDETDPRDTNPWEILDNKTSDECPANQVRAPKLVELISLNSYAYVWLCN
jgi:hypothetical protein